MCKILAHSSVTGTTIVMQAARTGCAGAGLTPPFPSGDSTVLLSFIYYCSSAYGRNAAFGENLRKTGTQGKDC